MDIFDDEIQDGLGEALSANASLAYAAVLTPMPEPEALAEKVKASLNNEDLYFLKTVLVTTGWNLNDDVFDPTEVWLARNTPEHKPFNYEHDCEKIIGHIVSNLVVDKDHKLVSDDTSLENVPDKLHIVTGAVIYKFWDKPELQEHMDKVLAEIEAGEWYVSMECLFKGFDYALIGADGSTRVVERNAQTAALTKNLRAYGGNGKYGEYRIGRLLRNIVFCGKGLVRKPANVDSVILPPSDSFSSKSAICENNFSFVSANQVYPTVDESINKQGNSDMDEKELEQLKLEKERLESLLKETQEALAKCETDKEELKAELKNLYDDQVRAKRVSMTKEKLKLPDEDANEFVQMNFSMSDEVFAKQLDVLSKVVSTPEPTPAPVAATIETDAVGEERCESSSLDSVEASSSASLLTVETDSGVDDVAQAIASYLAR